MSGYWHLNNHMSHVPEAHPPTLRAASVCYVLLQKHGNWAGWCLWELPTMEPTSASQCMDSMLAKLLAVGAITILVAAPHVALAGDTSTSTPAHSLRGADESSKPRLDFSGRRRIGIASFYADWFAGRKMADGVRMDPHGDNAASRTLPLGTVARVTNLRTNKSAVVIIQDRGPYVRGRIVDLSPSTARKIGITRKIGIAKVRVTPLAIPLRNGHFRLAMVHQRSSGRSPPL